MRVMSLFAGIGGFDLAAERMGWETVVQVEIDEWCRKVLAKNFPNAKRYADIKEFDTSPYRGSIDLVCGGFPCQPFSHAGKRRGAADDRALWPEMLRVIRDVAPRWVVGENVSGLLSQNAGLVFESMLVDLEAEGYTVWPYLLPACGVDAPHKRERVWIVAYRNDRFGQSADGQVQAGRNPLEFSGIVTADTAFDSGKAGYEQTGREAGADVIRGSIGPALADSDRERQQQPQGAFSQIGGWIGDVNEESITDTNGQCAGSLPQDLQRRAVEFGGPINSDANSPGLKESDSPGLAARPGEFTGRNPSHWSDWPTQPPICSGNDGISPELDRTRTITAAGNAVVWQVVYQIFSAIQQLESLITNNQ